MGITIEDIKKVKESNETSILGKPNVVGIGIGYKIKGEKPTEELAAIAFVREKIPKNQLANGDLIPSSLKEGGFDVPTDVLPVGVVKVQSILGGASIGHFNITAGTLGCLVTRGENEFILSNNHVLANSNRSQYKDSIFHPAPLDGGYFKNKIAELEEVIPIRFFGRNKVDAALAKPLERGVVERRIEYIGEPKGITDASVGLEIKKSGRTTLLTYGRIIATGASLYVWYGDIAVRFDKQLVTTPMSRGGDSVSVILSTMENKICGLLFAGSELVTLANRIQNVKGKFNIGFPGE